MRHGYEQQNSVCLGFLEGHVGLVWLRIPQNLSHSPPPTHSSCCWQPSWRKLALRQSWQQRRHTDRKAFPNYTAPRAALWQASFPGANQIPPGISQGHAAFLLLELESILKATVDKLTKRPRKKDLLGEREPEALSVIQSERGWTFPKNHRQC